MRPNWTNVDLYVGKSKVEPEEPEEPDSPEAAEQAELERNEKARKAESERSEKARQVYQELFKRVARRLEALVDKRTPDIVGDSIHSSILPPPFQLDQAFPVVNALPEVQAWATRERERLDNLQERDELANTFVLLTVLGAFGSMIFLTRDYIEKEVSTSVAAYFFRPILGILLAVAMFVIDVLLHSVISTANIAEVRQEPLYLLGLSAGILSEQAYGVVQLRAKNVLENYRKSQEDAG